MEFLAFLMQLLFVTTSNYSLIDWDKGNTLVEGIPLTPQEAHDLNYALAINNTTKRYVKDYHIEDNSIEKHIQSDNIKHINIQNNK